MSVICGCAHPKITNIVSYVKETFNENVQTLIVGLHLKYNTMEENIKIIKELCSADISIIIPLHSTGMDAIDLIRKEFTNNCINLKEIKEIIV